jgi:Ca-activated chloride channel family protein
MRLFVVTTLLLSLFIVPIRLNGQSGRKRADSSATTKTSEAQRAGDPTPAEPSDEMIIRPAVSGSGETVESDVVRIDTSLVMVPVTVMDRSGKYIPNLHRQDFHLLDNGIEQRIAYFGTVDQPFTVALVIDTSNSTHFRLEDIQDAAITFVNQLGPEDRVMVVSFDDDIKILTSPTSNRADLLAAIRRTRTGGGTRLYDAVDQVMQRLKSVTDRKAIVLFTDGVDTTSHRATYSSSVRNAQEQEAVIYPVAYKTDTDLGPRQIPFPSGRGGIILGLPVPGSRGRGPGGGGGRPGGGGSTPGDYRRGDQYLHDLAEASGGRFYRGDTLQGVASAFEQIADELHRQYSLGYYPTPPGPPGERREIKVKTNEPDLVVRARDSYISSRTKTKDSN